MAKPLTLDNYIKNQKMLGYPDSKKVILFEVEVKDTY